MSESAASGDGTSHSHGNTRPGNELSGGDKIDPPVQNLDRSLGHRKIGEAADDEGERDRDPRDAPLVGSGQNLRCLSSLRQTKQRP